MKLQDLIIDKNNFNIPEICEPWLWLISEQKEVLLITIFGDLFLIGVENEINWLDTSCGKLTKVAESIDDFKAKLKDDDNYNNWFLAWLHEDIENSGIELKENEVFSFKIMPVLSGKYTFDNIEPTDIIVHFQITGQICEQIQNHPDDTNIEIKVSE
jgi:hypothetical protein